MTAANPPRVVVVGAGFGGLWSLRTLARAPVELLLADRHNYHTFLPLLYQVAAAELEPEEIAYPVRSILRGHPRARFVLANVQDLDLPGHRVLCDGPPLVYDYLILALGSVSHVFGIPGAAEYSLPLKSVDQGIVLRNHILESLEHAVREPDAERRRRLLTFTIVGGGPTGAEFAGALAELLYGPIKSDYPMLDFREVRVLVVEASEGLLAGLPQSLRDYAPRRLRAMGVDVRLRAAVTRITPETVHLKDGTIIPTETVIWTAGVRGDPAAENWGLPMARNGRVAVLPTLQLPEHPEVYVVGDLAYVEQDGKPLPMVAPVAMQQGETAARNILRQINGQEPLPFRYKEHGMMATIGRNAAVAQIGGRTFTGFPAWVVWLLVHLVQLIGFRQRLVVMLSWAWDYFFFERVVRLILPSMPRTVPHSSENPADSWQKPQ
ncbi:MAG: NAD(P)/FAD-dependent oxidoreductase [Chloroflexota bacterium]|nr:MAG: NAD(P)/FAD-dependent oxidoreductase [Chloroflexota bacterium]